MIWTKNNVVLGMNLCLKNARSLLNDSKTLFASHSMRGSLIFSALALEETAKIWLLFHLYLCDPNSFSHKERNRMLKMLRSHEDKLYNSLYTVRGLAIQETFRQTRSKGNKSQSAKLRPLLLDLTKYIRDNREKGLHEMRLKCLYVDLTTKHMGPTPKVPAKTARALIRVAEATINKAHETRNSFKRIGQIPESLRPLHDIAVKLAKDVIKLYLNPSKKPLKLTTLPWPNYYHNS